MLIAVHLYSTTHVSLFFIITPQTHCFVCVTPWQQFKYSFTVETGLLNSILLANSHFQFPHYSGVCDVEKGKSFSSIHIALFFTTFLQNRVNVRRTVPVGYDLPLFVVLPQVNTLHVLSCNKLIVCRSLYTVLWHSVVRLMQRNYSYKKSPYNHAVLSL